MTLQNIGVIIVGGGITGISFGRLLQLGGFEDFLILEKEETAGGLCQSQCIKGHVLDLGGGHLLCSRHPEVYDFIFAHIPADEFHTFERVSKIAFDNETVDYPIEYNLWQLPLEKRVDYLTSCMQAARTAEAPENFEDWVRWKLGDAIADKYMIPYNRKVWGVEPNELDTDWLQKIPHHDTRLIVKTCLMGQGDQSVLPSHQTFMYPKRGGFQRIFDAIHDPVQRHARLSNPLINLRRTGDHWVVNESYRTKLVINTIPWGVLHSATHSPPQVSDEVARLRTSGLVVTLHEEAYDHDCHWTYVASPGQPHHREFYINNFAPHSEPNGIFRETNIKRFGGAPDALAVHINEHAYPIPLKGHSEAARQVWTAYANIGVIGVGRWGQHRYYNSDVCIREAMRTAQELLTRGMTLRAGEAISYGSSGLV